MHAPLIICHRNRRTMTFLLSANEILLAAYCDRGPSAEVDQVPSCSGTRSPVAISLPLSSVPLAEPTSSNAQLPSGAGSSSACSRLMPGSAGGRQVYLRLDTACRAAPPDPHPRPGQGEPTFLQVSREGQGGAGGRGPHLHPVEVIPVGGHHHRPGGRGVDRDGGGGRGVANGHRLGRALGRRQGGRGRLGRGWRVQGWWRRGWGWHVRGRWRCERWRCERWRCERWRCERSRLGRGQARLGPGQVLGRADGALRGTRVGRPEPVVEVGIFGRGSRIRCHRLRRGG